MALPCQKAARGWTYAEGVGWMERSDTHHRAARMSDGLRKGSTHSTGLNISDVGCLMRRHLLEFVENERSKRVILDTRNGVVLKATVWRRR